MQSKAAFQSSFVKPKWEEFRGDVLEPLRGKKRTSRISSAFQDVLYTADLKQYIRLYEPLDTLDDSEGFEFKKNHIAHMHSVTVLKAVYYFSATYLDVFIKDIFCSKKSFVTFVQKHADPVAKRMTVKDVMPAYCTVIYRNKLIAHHDEVRLDTSISSSDGHVWLSPESEERNLSAGDKAILKKLLRKYSLSHELDADNIEHLFYTIPMDGVGNQGQDRKNIDKIIERYGCYSVRSEEIIEGLLLFSRSAVKALKVSTA